jgi:hypothetical protein
MIISTYTMLYVFPSSLHRLTHVFPELGSQKKVDTPGRKFVFACMIFMFALSTLYWVMSIANEYHFMKSNFPTQLPNTKDFLPLYSAIALINVTLFSWWTFLFLIQQLFQYVLTDAVVVWRGWALCRRDFTKMLWIPLFFLGCTACKSHTFRSYSRELKVHSERFGHHCVPRGAR